MPLGRSPFAPAPRERHHGRMWNSGRCFLVCACLAAALPVWATPLFDRQDVLDVQLIGPLHSVIRNKERRTEYPFVLRNGDTDLRIGIRARGKSRVKLCRFPPLRLNFAKSEAAQGAFAGLGRLKLVTHCRGRGDGEQNLLEEYLAYRIFGALTDVGYRVRLLRIVYIDTEERVDTGDQARYAFVIEPLQELADRVGGVPLETAGVSLRQLEPGHTALMYVFQYLIGNTDWSFVTAENEEFCCHNGDLVDIAGMTYLLPYDFDMTGFVSARYAKPRPEMRLRSVRQRRFRGFCTDGAILRAAIRRVNARREDIYRVVRSTPGLTAEGAENAVGYLAGYFEQAGEEDELLESFERDCLEG